MTHTATPWEVWKSEEHEKFGPLVYITAQISESKLDGVPAIATWRDMDTAKANAEFIVRAVNSHEELMRVLEEISQHAYEDDTPLEDILSDFDRMRELASTAIALAEGGKQ